MTKRGTGAWKPGRKTRSGRAQRDLLRVAQEMAERARHASTTRAEVSSEPDLDEGDDYVFDPADDECGICGDPVYRCYCNGG